MFYLLRKTNKFGQREFFHKLLVCEITVCVKKISLEKVKKLKFDNFRIQQKTNGDSDQGFENECTLVWVKLLGFSMELWMEKGIQAIGDRISKTILVYGSFLTSSFQLVAKLLVELKFSDGLYQSVELVIKGHIYNQDLDCLNIPFLVHGFSNMIMSTGILVGH